ncbi:MAG: NfeD family protein [Gemmatimonadota bacterium]|nr:NfeD family protein [Gemmatimonadota bacterium]
MSYIYLASFIGGLLLGVRLMFYGAEHRRRPSADALPLRRWEPGSVGFLVMFGILGYIFTRNATMSLAMSAAMSVLGGAAFGLLVTWLAIKTARLQPEHDPDDPRYVLQGRVGVVTVPIPVGGEGMIRYEENGSAPLVPARDIDGGAIAAGEEICIERVEDGVAHVELWRLVEQRL